MHYAYEMRETARIVFLNRFFKEGEFKMPRYMNMLSGRSFS
jgi:hypothetical protein